MRAPAAGSTVGARFQPLEPTMTILIHPTISGLTGDRHAAAIDTWRAAARLVSERWTDYRVADRVAGGFAFRAYVAALDAEEAAADELAHLTLRAAA